MPQVSNLQKLAGRPADHPRRGVTDFIEANEDVIRAAISRQHSWTVIFEEAVKDGCPTISVRYFTRAAKSVLGLTTGGDNLSRSDKARGAAEDTAPQRLPRNGQGQSRKIASAASTRNPNSTEPSPPIEQRRFAVETDSALEVGDKAESNSVISLGRNSSSTEIPNPSGTSGVEVAAAEALSRGTASPFVPPRPLSPTRKSESENSWDSAAPGQRAMLLKDAE